MKKKAVSRPRDLNHNTASTQPEEPRGEEKRRTSTYGSLITSARFMHISCITGRYRAVKKIQDILPKDAQPLLNDERVTRLLVNLESECECRQGVVLSNGLLIMLFLFPSYVNAY